MPDLRLLSVDESQLARAYPLVRSAAPVGRERWESFARELIAAGGGILAVEADGGCLHGVATFRPAGSLRDELSLQVEIMVAFELSRLAPVRKTLCSGLEDVARERGCHSIVFTMAARTHSEPGSAPRSSWEELGARMELVSFVQRLVEEKGEERRKHVPCCGYSESKGSTNRPIGPAFEASN